MRYTLIHPTKSGGTSIENFFYLHYRSSFRGMGHASICKNNNNPIIVVRDVKSRFLFTKFMLTIFKLHYIL